MEVVASIVAEAVVAIGRLFSGSIYSMIVDTVKYQSNLDALDKEMKPLMALRDDVKNETELAEIEGKVPRTRVIEWLKEVDELLLKVDQIQAVKLSRLPLNCSKGYRISREAAENLREIQRLLKAGSFHTGSVSVSYSAPSAVEHIPGHSIQDQTTASTTLSQTMTLLSDPTVLRIGIWGMGGVGKTTLIRNLNNKLKGTSSILPFSIVIWATVSKNFDMKKVQIQIAERLNLKAKKEESTERLSILLYERLEKEKNFLLILDDIWAKIDLHRLGIPEPGVEKGSKIILTTRSLDICRYMMTDVEVKVNGLNDEEAWQLFSRYTGSVVSSEHVRPFAEAIARECCGLPLAITIVGAAMRGKTMVRLWEDALNELQRSRPNIGGVEDEVYKPLKWSYDSLQGKRIKSCFLYCSLFPEDFAIGKSELVKCWLAEGLLDEQENYEASLNRGIAMIESLKDSCLLEEGIRECTVKMHDIVRDVAIWIASSSEDECKSLVRSGMGLTEISAVELLNSLRRVSFMNNKIKMLPDRVIQCSEATTLLLQGNSHLDGIPERFLQGFGALRVLNLSRTNIHSLPLSLLQLDDLRALLLKDCLYLEELPSLERLSRLEVLDLSATPIKELPRGMENLSNLRQLILSRTRHLKTIQTGIISRLSCLEYLDMTHSGYQLRVKREVEEKQTSFEELLCLERLLVLFIHLERIPCLSSEPLSSVYRLTRFQFLIGPHAHHLKGRHAHDKRTVTVRALDLSAEPIWCLLSIASSLLLNHCWGLNEMLENLVINSVGSFAGLKSLTIRRSDCSFRPGRGCAGTTLCDLLPNLEELHLEYLSCIESISELVSHLGLRFLRLKSIVVANCPKLKNLLSCGFFIHDLPNLDVIKVSFCDELDELFNCLPLQNMDLCPVVPNLRVLKLKDVPKLRAVCRDEETWPCLEQVDVIDCSLLRKLPLTNRNAENMKKIRGESQWWNALEWDADITKSNLQPYFHPAEASRSRKEWE
ncbi:disease resistance protein At4g27190 [Juglans microcarpa x Juglans regia]|uniref:disease resistance protein At4g27190 n=1 Tax=Juglans microcarpa x Juglans regia TaxID=2249226 RepID=UPI001B7E956E|nr:disease resistance protein At4g27190 [Juglans microcarpa x Juglans regia]